MRGRVAITVTLKSELLLIKQPPRVKKYVNMVILSTAWCKMQQNRCQFLKTCCQ